MTRTVLRDAARHILVRIAVTLVTLAAIGDIASAATWQRFELDSGTYARWYLPDAAPANEALPVVVFLHGAGSSPEIWFSFLTDLAESRSVVLLLPRSISTFGWGVGDDARSIDEALDRLDQTVEVDATRISIAGHSSGGSFAYVFGLAGPRRFAGIFSLSAPFRTVLARAQDGPSPPIRLYYGESDPNIQILAPLTDMLDRLGTPWEIDRQAGFGHNNFPATTLPSGFDFLLAQRYEPPSPPPPPPPPGLCQPTATRMCLRDGRFAVEVRWHDPRARAGDGMAIAGGDDTTGVFWFFRPSNWEMLVKVLDGCTTNERFWVFASSATTLGYRLTVTDLESGIEAVYENSLGQAAPAITDTRAFATCP